MRIGQIIKLIPDRKFGFIRTEHFRNDVFFHFSCLKELEAKYLWVGQDVEFEINELLRLGEQKREATVVQRSTKPLSKTLNELNSPELKPAHHPRARQRKPSWREKPTSTADDSTQDTPNLTEHNE